MHSWWSTPSIIYVSTSIYGVDLITSTKLPKEDMGVESKGNKYSSSSNTKHDINGDNYSYKNGTCGNSSVKEVTIVSTASPRYLEMREGRDKPKMHDREIMEVVTDANETFEVASLMADPIVHITIIRAIENFGRTMIALTSMGIILGRTCISWANHQVISSVIAIILWDDCGITSRD